MSDIEWQDPPIAASGAGSDRWGAVAKTLRERPNQWALISGESGLRSPQNISRGKAFRGGGFEFTTRRRDDNPPRWDVYARYVGEVS